MVRKDQIGPLVSEARYHEIVEGADDFRSRGSVPSASSVERRTGTANKDVLKEAGMEPVVRFNAFGECALEFKLYFWVGDFITRYRVAHELRKEIGKKFSAAGIEIPFPQRTIYIKESPKK
jgi:small-conductance mechanosensitive channel